MMDARLKMLAVLPLLLILAVLFTVSRIDLERFVLRPAERRMLQFSPEKSEMGIMQPAPVTKYVSLRSVDFLYPDTTGKETHSAVRREAPQVSAAKKQDVRMESHVAETEQTDSKENAPPGQDSDDPQENPRLTFVVLNERRSIAIMDDHVMHEGDSFGNITVRKIEQDRVLVGTKRLRWIYMEEEK